MIDERREERERMVRRLGSVPPEVRRALLAVPRHRFVPAEYRQAAYEDEPLPLPHAAATISAPHMVAIQLETARLSSGQSVLEVGAGYGYLAAAVAEMVRPNGRVIAVEVELSLATEASRRIGSSGYGDTVEVHADDGTLGYPPAAPFDRIIVSCASDEIFPSWMAQLRENGVLLVPLGDAWEQMWTRVTKSSEGLVREPLVACRFVPLRRIASRSRSPHI